MRRPAAARPPSVWEPAAQRVLDGAEGFVRVLGGPGTGKTRLLVEMAADRILRGGVDPEQLLVVTANRRAAVEVRAGISALLTAGSNELNPRTAREPLVRTVHSYAFSVLRLHAAMRDVPGPRLLSGPEQDAVVRELLAGDLEDDVDYWPDRLWPALPVPGFAEELRDLMLRAAERGLGPEDLIKIGRDEKREEWVSAGKFARQYEQVTLLAGVADSAVAQESAPALDAAELVASALLAFETDAELLASERDRVRYLLVDDAQHLDPLQYRLLARLGFAAKEFVLAGDPDQAVFSFRGADPRLLGDTEPDGGTVVLRETHRMAPVIRQAVARLAARLPGSSPQRPRVAEGEPEGGDVTVRLHTTDAAEAAWVADQLRRAHLIDGVPWSDMAVLARSATNSVPVLQRALSIAGIPVLTDAEELPLARQPAVRPFLELLRCAATPGLIDPYRAELLLSCHFGGADPLALRRLRRGLRRLELASGHDRPSDELLVEVLRDNDVLAALEDSEAVSVRRVAGLLATARQAIAEGVGLEQVLWLVWQQSGLEPRWTAQSSRGGTLGAQADRDLDAIVGLFHAAARYADRLPGSGVTGFADFLAAQRIVGDTLAPSAQRGEAVEVLTAHAAVGREWTVVAVIGVQEGTWPDLRLRGSLLGVERLVDRLAGVDDVELSATAPLLAEERRLLMVAASRARRTLLVSAIRGEDEQPSRFLAELTGMDIENLEDAGRVMGLGGPRRALILADLVGELRRAVCDGTSPPDRRRRAARQLARLADAGVPGASPDYWYGLPELSSVEPLRARGDRVSVSPSTVEVLAKCPLRWMVERHGGSDPAELASITGVLVHALAQAAASGADEVRLRAELDRAWDAVDAGAPWFSRRERARVHAMMDTFLGWLRATRGDLTQVAVEHDFSLDLPESEPPVRIRGRVDRLETDASGRPVVVDVKTGRAPVTADEAREHPQLAVYQLAAAYGAFTELGLDTEPGGARLLYVSKANRKTVATERNQDPVDEEGLKHWTGVVADAAAASTGPEYVARQNPDCPRCPVRTACPMQASGRQVPE